MSNKYSKSLFESIKDALNKPANNTSENFKDFLRLEKEKTYLVRLVPNVEAPERTFFHYFHHFWNSKITKQNVSILCPSTYGERCPIEEYRQPVYKSKNTAAIEAIKDIKRNENWLVNVYVIKDPTNPDNQGQVKILRYGKQLADIINDAIADTDPDFPLGDRIFDLSKDGCNLRITVGTNEGGYATYVKSRFVNPSALEGVEDVETIYKDVHDLDSIFPHKSYEEIDKALKVHFLGEAEEKVVHVDEEESYVAPVSTKTQVQKDVEEAEEAVTKAEKPTTTEQSTTLDDATLDILKDL